MSTSDSDPRPPCKRGSLRIYFGAADGVGKTDAMLAAARLWQQQGRAVLVGTAAGAGFDLDAALACKPSLVVLGDLASANQASARHPQRWQDADELRNAGIDVYTTLNVEQLESLFDVVRAITGTAPAQSLPDTVFDGAEQIVFVDVAPDQGAHGAHLIHLARYGAGAMQALRELALRRTAQQAEHAVRAHRSAGAIEPVWKTGAALLACVAADGQAQQVIRSAAQLASQVGADWHVIHVETPSVQRQGTRAREQLAQAFALARSLGASTTLLAGSDIALMIADYARSQNFSRIVLGRSRRSSAMPWRAAQLRRIAAYAPDIDLIETGQAGAAPELPDTRAGAAPAAPAPLHERSRRQRYLLAGGASVLTALLTAPLLPYFDLANIAMLFLLTVVLVAVRFGREASVVSTVVGAAALLLSARRLSFGAADLQYSVTFLVMLAVGLITASLTADLRYQARFALQREARSRALYEFARSLSSALQTEQVFDITRAFIQQTFQAHATLLLPDANGRLAYPAAQGTAQVPVMSVLDMGVAQWAFDRALAAGTGTDTLPGNSFYYLPLVAPMRTRGVLAICCAQDGAALGHEQRKQLETFAALAAIALERVHYVEVAQEAMVRMESERLRNSLLAALSHDLRTPLTSLVGLSESLALSRPALSAAQAEMAIALRDEAVRMSTLVANLLDMARIQSGHVRLNLQWQTLEEMAGSALRASRRQLGGHELWTRIAHDLPLVRYDAVLLERVLCNLLENAAKYTPPGSRIGITAQPKGGMMEVTVHDNGRGLPAGREEEIFEKFTRGERESPIPGVGLGLAICRAIIEAHGGTIRAGASPEGGAAFIFGLPLGTPPQLPLMDDGDRNSPGAAQ